MKKIITCIALVSLFSCKAQNIVAYDSDESFFKKNSGEYYKDTHNFFNTFEGEWKWVNTATNSSLTFIFKKEENLSSARGYTYDLLVGEYKYVENGNELANTLLLINNTNISGHLHKISGMIILKKRAKPECSECVENERRLQVSIDHQNDDRVQGNMVMRRFVENGVPKIKAIIYDGSKLSMNPNAPEYIVIPFGEYILTKQ